MNIRIFAIAGTAASVLALAACASHPQGKQQVAKQSNSKMVCMKLQPLGSHIPQVSCMTQHQYAEYRKQEAQNRANSQHALNQADTQGNISASGDGGGGGL